MAKSPDFNTGAAPPSGYAPPPPATPNNPRSTGQAIGAATYGALNSAIGQSTSATPAPAGLPNVGALETDPSYLTYKNTLNTGLNTAEGNAGQTAAFDRENAAAQQNANNLSYANSTHALDDRYQARGLGWGSGQQEYDQGQLGQANALRQNAIQQALAQQIGGINQSEAAAQAAANEKLVNYGLSRAPGVDLRNMPGYFASPTAQTTTGK